MTQEQDAKSNTEENAPTKYVPEVTKENLEDVMQYLEQLIDWYSHLDDVTLAGMRAFYHKCLDLSQRDIGRDERSWYRFQRLMNNLSVMALPRIPPDHLKCKLGAIVRSAADEEINASNVDASNVDASKAKEESKEESKEKKD